MVKGIVRKLNGNLPVIVRWTVFTCGLCITSVIFAYDMKASAIDESKEYSTIRYDEIDKRLRDIHYDIKELQRQLSELNVALITRGDK